ncbi:family 20 glycosylhydrolase [Actinotalea soli]|uniref:family 20 glycosylhydrolase n=1 Tax=Actinotalea soli TaxID=2819234 RepID=UPI0027DB7623|nr:family 20 glycosylhydrolase [Actinotalea soli]
MTLPLVPLPEHVEVLDLPPFTLTAETVVEVDRAGDEVGRRLASRLGALVGAGLALEVEVSDGPGAGVGSAGEGRPRIRVRVEDQGRAGETAPTCGAALRPVPGAYALRVVPGEVDLVARERTGLLHGLATLAQLVQHPLSRIAACQVVDAPRYPWRGLSLDLARRFHGPATVRTVIDVMASLKLGVLHLHLTDDQGWRLEIPSRPELTARSGGTAVDGGPAGFLTVEEYAGLVAYAAERGVVVVPEIDLPGHVNAALHACPELNPSGQAAPPYTGIEVGFSRLDATLPATDAFLVDVLDDVAAMTPGPWVHLGGDEALASDPEEYRVLVTRAAEILRAAGKEVVGWQELARLSLGPGSAVQYWTSEQDPGPVVAAALAGADVVMSPASRTYLDLKYDATTALGLEWAGHVEVRDSYDWDPDLVLPLPAERVRGVEAALWSETLRTPGDLFHMLLPRLAAVAEVAWTPQHRRDWAGFAARVPTVAAAWDRAGLAWYRSPQITWHPAAPPVTS